MARYRRYRRGRRFVVVGIRFGRRTNRAYWAFLKRRRWADNVRNRMTFLGKNRRRFRAIRRFKGKIAK